MSLRYYSIERDGYPKLVQNYSHYAGIKVRSYRTHVWTRVDNCILSKCGNIIRADTCASPVAEYISITEHMVMNDDKVIGSKQFKREDMSSVNTLICRRNGNIIIRPRFGCFATKRLQHETDHSFEWVRTSDRSGCYIKGQGELAKDRQVEPCTVASRVFVLIHFMWIHNHIGILRTLYSALGELQRTTAGFLDKWNSFQTDQIYPNVQMTFTIFSCSSLHKQFAPMYIVCVCSIYYLSFF